MTPEQVKFTLGIVLAVFVFLGGMMVERWRNDSVQLQIEKVAKDARSATADEISKIRVENKSITAKTVEIIRQEVVYRECAADDAMMELTNKARGF